MFSSEGDALAPWSADLASLPESIRPRQAEGERDWFNNRISWTASKSSVASLPAHRRRTSGPPGWESMKSVYVNS